MRKPFIAGNWKMHKTPKESLELAKGINEYMKNKDLEVDVLICPPFTSLYLLDKEIENRKFILGAQNMCCKDEGALTGEISPLMLKELNIEYVLIGHSERRQFFKEGNQKINKKLKKALEHKIKPILCVGETLEERENNKEKEKIETQIKEALKEIDKKEFSDITIAYEPIWAIGTGKTASSDDAQKMIAYIRDIIKGLSNKEIADSIRIQYGGSVKAGNIKELMDKEDIDGALVGGASLDSESFIKIFDYNV